MYQYLVLIFAFTAGAAVAALSANPYSAAANRRFKRAEVEQYGCTPWCQCSATCGSGTQKRTCGVNEETRPCTLGPCSQWGEWQQWTLCSATCGDGTKRRSRFCNTYYGCPGDATQTDKCNEAACDQLTQWGPWGKCSAFCDTGKRTRGRSCSVAGGCAGEKLQEDEDCAKNPCCTTWSPWGECSVTCGEGGSKTRTQRCMIEMAGAPYGYASETRSDTAACDPAPPPCAQYEEWGGWSSCTVTCGGGERNRERACTIAGKCDKLGPKKESIRCHTELCPTWSTEWSAWTLCSVTCSGGTKKRSRQCEQAGQCTGDSVQEEKCNTFACPAWTEWGQWSFCSQSCGGGWQRRGRVCNQYNLCPGDNFEKRLCNEHTCPAMGDWFEWGNCTAECGGGSRTRTRPCLLDSTYCVEGKLADATCQCEGSNEESGECMTHKCAEWGAWKDYGACSAQCGGGDHTRTRVCENDIAFCVGDNDGHVSCQCIGDNQESGKCNEHICPQWSEWDGWGECSATCGGGAMERKRTCKKDETYCSGKTDDETCTCPGLDHSNDACNMQLCAAYASWGRWGACSSPCGGGEQKRDRRCQVDPDYCQGENATLPSCVCNDGNAEESQPCNSHYCAKVAEWAEWGQCSKPCGGGTQSRQRPCDTDKSFCTGTKLSDASCKCTDTLEESQPCNNFTCANWGEWKEFGECSVTCGDGVKERTRDCQRDTAYCTEDLIVKDTACQCVGNSAETEDCNAGECFTWAEWESWGSCSKVCGGGSRDRARQCPQADACPGLGSETEFCNQEPCPDWGEWGEWSSCSVTCGGGQRVRNRACPLEGGCSPGEASEVEVCSDAACPVWAEWGSWGSCTATCGNGQRERTRPCEGTGECLGRGSEDEACFITACQLTTFWSAWSPCTQTCGAGGKKTRSKASGPEAGAQVVSEQEPCNEEIVCPEWASWAEWSACSKTCGGGSRTRERKCAETATGVEVPNGCVGKKVEIDGTPCNPIGCSG